MSIRIKVSDSDFNKIVSAMRTLDKSEESLLKTSVNNTAKKAQKVLSKQAATVYAGPGQTTGSRAKIDKASVRKPQATINFISTQPDLTKFRVSAYGKTPSRTAYIAGKRVQYPIMATQFAGSSMKTIHSAGNAVFCVRFKSGHVAIVKRPSGDNRGKLTTLMGSSDMAMVRNDKVYGSKAEMIQEMLETECSKQLEKALARAASGGN